MPSQDYNVYFKIPETLSVSEALAPSLIDDAVLVLTKKNKRLCAIRYKDASDELKKSIRRYRDYSDWSTADDLFYEAYIECVVRGKIKEKTLFRRYDDTEIHTWFERDRAHVELRDKVTEKTIVEWWDEAVSQVVEDGFLTPKNWHGSAFNYAVDRGFIEKAVREF
jgi:hypothetical protein